MNQVSRTFIKSIFRFVPRKVKALLIDSYFIVVDLFKKHTKKRLFGEQAHLVPPLRLMYDGPRSYSSYKQNGTEFLGIFVCLCRLQTSDHILDVGSGIGRKTLPLLTYINPSIGRYDGIDAYKPHVDWCKKNIEAAYPHFRFRHADVWNKLYNPGGKIRPSEYKFPFEDDEFDFVIVASLFTHMFATDMRHYMAEIDRVLKLGGRGIISYFLLNEESERFIEEGESTLELIYEVEQGCKADNRYRLESAVGHSEKQVLQFYTDCGIKTTIYYGSWCGRAEYLTYQDLICLEK